MVPCALEGTMGKIKGYACPVPSCSRHHDGQKYFDEPAAAVSGTKPLSDQPAPAGVVILRAVHDKPSQAFSILLSTED